MERARRLVRKVERAIETGAFTPELSYLYESSRLGACGCAHAAAQFVAGVPLDNGDYPGWQRVPGLSDVERVAIEAGYEGGGDPGSRAFFAAGRELRKFHPGVRS